MKPSPSLAEGCISLSSFLMVDCLDQPSKVSYVAVLQEGTWSERRSQLPQQDSYIFDIRGVQSAKSSASSVEKVSVNSLGWSHWTLRTDLDARHCTQDILTIILVSIHA